MTIGFQHSRTVGRLTLMCGADRWKRHGGWVSVLFHHLTDGARWRSDDPFIAGLGVDMSLDLFADRIDSLARRYKIVGLDEVLNPESPTGRRRRLLLCFDDAYASVAQLAAPVLEERGLPWCLFLNSALVGNNILALDNLVAYVANTVGLAPLARVADTPVDSPASMLRGPLAMLAPEERRAFARRLAIEAELDTALLVRKASLYLEPADVRGLAAAGVEIGNHTAEHVSCRMLDDRSAEEQIVQSAVDIGSLTGRPVRGFAYPYGSLVDATALTTSYLRASGHLCAFVVEGRDNTNRTDPFRLHRIGLSGEDDASNAIELTILPRLRSLRAHLRTSRR